MDTQLVEVSTVVLFMMSWIPFLSFINLSRLVGLVKSSADRQINT